MRETTVRTALEISLDRATGKSSFVKKYRLARIAYTYLSGDLCCVRCASCYQRATSTPHQLQSSKDSYHGNRRLQLIRGDPARQQAAKHNPRNATEK
jgi:hypothetical protein